MKVFWLCNIPHPDICQELLISPSPGGSWISSLFREINNDVDIVYIFPGNIENSGYINNIHYYQFIENKNVVETFKKIIKIEQPDLIHIFGTESPHSACMVKANNGEKTLISIQGIISRIKSHCRNTLPNSVYYGFTTHDLLTRSNPFLTRRKMDKKGKQELNLFKQAKFITGRTEWDYAATCQLAPQAKYYFCREIIRNSFFSYEWRIERCKRHSIFMTNGYAIYKGFHDLLTAMPYVLSKYSDAKIRVIGKDPRSIPWYKLSTYNRFIIRLIKQYKLDNVVEFCGYLSEKEFAEELVSANVFTLTSAIENSPNSLVEAMIVGTPIVCSDVGGVKDILSHNINGYVYQQNAPYMLAHYICKIFEQEEKTVKMSVNSRARSREEYNSNLNANEMLKIYRDIIQIG